MINLLLKNNELGKEELSSWRPIAREKKQNKKQKQKTPDIEQKQSKTNQTDYNILANVLDGKWNGIIHKLVYKGQTE